MTRAISLLSLAFFCMALIFFPLFIFQIFRYLYRDMDLEPFLFGLAKAFDYVFAFLIFGVWGHTLSALVWKKDIKFAIIFIDRLFMDDKHCKSQYMDEFNG